VVAAEVLEDFAAEVVVETLLLVVCAELVVDFELLEEEELEACCQSA